MNIYTRFFILIACIPYLYSAQVSNGTKITQYEYKFLSQQDPKPAQAHADVVNSLAMWIKDMEEAEKNSQSQEAHQKSLKK